MLNLIFNLLSWRGLDLYHSFGRQHHKFVSNWLILTKNDVDSGWLHYNKVLREGLPRLSSCWFEDICNWRSVLFLMNWRPFSSSAHLLGMLLHCILHILIFLSRVTLSAVSKNFHRVLVVSQIFSSNPFNGACSSSTLKHFFSSDLHNSSASSERFSNSHVLSVGRGVTSLPPYRNRRPRRWIHGYHILFALSFFSTSKTGEAQGMIR